MCLRSFKRRLGKHLEEGHVVGDKTEKLQQVLDSPWLKSVRAERLLGEKLAVLVLPDTLPRLSPSTAPLEAEYQAGRTVLRSCTTALMPYLAVKKATVSHM